MARSNGSNGGGSSGSSARSYVRPHTMAEALDLSPQTVRRMIADGDIRGVKIRGRWRVSRAEWARFLDGLEK